MWELLQLHITPRWTANLNMGLLDQNAEHRTQKWVLVISSESLAVTEVKSTLRAFQLGKLLNFFFKLSDEKFSFSFHTDTHTRNSNTKRY